MADNLFTGAITDKWGLLTNWSQGTVPTASDGFTTRFDASSPSCTMDTTSKVCQVIDFTGYTNTITFTTQLTVSGSVTLGSGMSFSGAAGLLVNATATLTSNGTTCPQPLTLNGTITYTISGTWTNSGLVTLGGTTLTTTINTGTIDCGAGLTCSGTTAILQGTATVRLTGTGTYTPQTGSGTNRLAIVFVAGGGTITIGAASPMRVRNGSVTYTSGTMVTTGSTLIVNSTQTLDTSGMTWDLVQLIGGNTITLTSAINVGGLLTLGDTTNGVTINGGNINASAGITHGGSTSFVNGTATLRAIGTGTYTNPTSTGTMQLSFVINTAGTLTISSTNSFQYKTGTLTYTAGTVVVTNSTLSLLGTGSSVATLDTSGMTWNNVTVSGGITVTNNSALNVGGLLTLGSGTNTNTINGSNVIAANGLTHGSTTGVIAGTSLIRLTGNAKTYTVSGDGRITSPVSIENNTTMAGAKGFDLNSLSMTTVSKTLTLVATNTYRVRNQLTLRGSTGTNVSLVSGTPSSAALFVVDNAANQSVRYVTATDINSSGGDMVHDFRGTLLRTVNWDLQRESGVLRGLPSAFSRLRPSPSL